MRSFAIHFNRASCWSLFVVFCLRKWSDMLSLVGHYTLHNDASARPSKILVLISISISIWENSWVSEPERATWMMSNRVDANAASENDISYISLSFWMMNFPFWNWQIQRGCIKWFSISSHAVLCALQLTHPPPRRTARTSALRRRLDVFHAKLTFSSFHMYFSLLYLSSFTPWTRIDLPPTLELTLISN